MILSLATLPASAAAQDADLPRVVIEGPTVILFWTDPDSVTDPDMRMGLYSALDQQQTVMADTRDALNELGMVDVSQPGRRFVIADGGRERIFEAAPDSSVVGYVLAAPDRDLRVLYRVQFTDAMLEAARAFLGGSPTPDQGRTDR